MKNKFFLKLFLTFISASAYCQQVMTLENAIDRALNNNFSIRIARNESEIKNNDASAGNAGMLPQVNGNADYISSTNSTKQSYSDGSEINKDGAKQTTLVAGVTLDWVLFDGLKMFASYDKLKALSEQGKIDLKIQMENVIVEVVKAYYGIVKESQLLEALEESFTFYEERLSIAEKRYTLGSSSKLGFLQSKVDLNEQQAAILQQQENLIVARTELNRLLIYPVDSNFLVEDTIIFNYDPDYASLKTGLANNFQLLSIEKNIGISRYSMNELKGLRFPIISANAGYLYSDNKNDAGFFLKNQTNSLQFGFTARYNLFNGFNTSRQIKNANINLLNSQLQLEETNHSLHADLVIAYEHFKNSKNKLKLEEDNIGYAHENAFVFTESFRLGGATILQVKFAQESLNDAIARLVNVRYETKIAEVELMRLTGQLVK